MFSCFNAGKLDRNEDFSTVTNGDSATDLGMQSEHGERLTEKIAAVPHLSAIASNIKAKTHHAEGKGNMDYDPTRRFVRELTKRSAYRRRIAELVKEHSLGGEGGATHILAYINDNEHAVPSLLALRSAMQQMKSSDLMMWASRYNLFVLWSADRMHPWDSMDKAHQVAATLEIGKLSGTHDEVLVMIDGQRIKNFEFKNCVLKTLEPVSWTTPSGEEAFVHLELRMSTFFGYNTTDESVDELDSLRYLGTQCHGIMWPASDHATLADWPIAPPLIAGKVNVAGRDAALSPPASDSLSAFKGTYKTHLLPKNAGYPATKGMEISIAGQGVDTRVMVDNVKVDTWTFGPNNMLTYQTDAGHSAWLQFVHLAQGPILLGKFRETESEVLESFNVFGEIKGQSSHLTPNSVVDSVVNECVSANLGVASTILLADVLTTAERIWSANKAALDNEEAAARQSVSLTQLSKKVAALIHLEDLCVEGDSAFMKADAKGSLVVQKEIDPNSAKLAQMAEAAAKDKTEVTRQAALTAEKEATDTESQYQQANAAMATYKASQTAWKACQAAEAAGEAEAFANEAASHARNARTAAALTHALGAAQAYNEARLEAVEAAKAERRAAEAALNAVEGGIDFYAKNKNFDKLKEIAEASAVATKARQFAQAAVQGWEDDSVASRSKALESAKAASESAQECYKHMRRVQPAKEQQ